jgi:hypothetical protein
MTIAPIRTAGSSKYRAAPKVMDPRSERMKKFSLGAVSERSDSKRSWRSAREAE